MSAGVRLFLVRHGESTWNERGILQGQTMEVPLTERGRRQAVAAAERLAGLTRPAPRIITSDQHRAVETATIIAGRLGGGVERTPLLREQALGELEGRPTASLEAQPVPEGFDISEVAWGGGESLLQVHRRLTRLVERLRAATGERDLVLVSHGDTLRVLLAVLDGRDHRQVAWTPFDNGEVRMVRAPLVGH